MELTPHARIQPPHPTPRHLPRVVRDFVTSVLHAQRLGGIVDDAALCVSELVTNSCVHAAATGAGLLVVTNPAGVRATVFDADVTLPVMKEGYDAESGRGLWILDSLTDGRWGAARGGWRTGHRSGEGGKGVWFELGTGPSGWGR
ncbi:MULTISPECIES: ATP-binding protein [unclassified Streptomyces]|uniref:ATP-binding protein n=1 Tax=unclassified Streptomyces TaxID=2593676 RepID=UPI002365DBEF|nr:MULTISPECIES: ATP-binding protein [unclassified Streptomyces]MDF3143019.1 ATP-binding protein [Streptomyces sp. T21Q-yed]WDF38540.1 ATP-binding protein [Streptomyces sp. T12]